MPPSGRGREIARCSFCGKSRKMVEHLVGGPPGIHICNECIDLCNSFLIEERRKTAKVGGAGGALTADSLPPPAQIKEHLDEYVIGQERAKRTLSVAVHNHYKRILYQQSEPEEGEVELEKSNILLIGPTGSGKTLLARTLARIMQVPFAIGDATTLTEAGYVGEDVENLLLKLIQAAGGDIELAQRGIIFIDEIDKIGKTTQNVSITRDVSGEGVQQALLKMLEGTLANVPPQGGRKHPEQSYIQIDTTDILFVCGGAFVGLDDIIKKRTGHARIGFNAGVQELDVAPEMEIGELLKLCEPDDILKFGLIPELVGRLPVYATLDPPDAGLMRRILTQPKNALARQYQKYFQFEGCDLKFEDDALEAIATEAVKRETGARALRSIMEEFMLDGLFELPTLAPELRGTFKVTGAVVAGEASLLPEPEDDEGDDCAGDNGEEAEVAPAKKEAAAKRSKAAKKRPRESA